MLFYQRGIASFQRYMLMKPHLDDLVRICDPKYDDVGVNTVKENMIKIFDEFGVTGYMLSHLRDIKNVVVIDVGCSNGKVVLGSKQCLSKHGIDIYAVGIDISTRKISLQMQRKI